jgi:hypothetical protein
MKVPLPKDQYFKKIEVNDDGLEIELGTRKKVALVFISVNNNYWPYLKQVIEDCKKFFLPQHHVDYLVWTDMPEKGSKEYNKLLSNLLSREDLDKVKGNTGVYPNNQFFSREEIKTAIDYVRDLKEASIFETEPIGWPAPTLMRYHLFLNQEEKLKEYDYVYYLDADMRVLEKISDEILTEGLLAAEHPMYALRKEYVPPYEPNKDSTAYIPRPGAVLVDENGKARFKPYYYAGGFQGGVASEFIKAMNVMKENIDKDFNNNYTAIWNDESHWNKYLYGYEGKVVVLSPSYIYPDSLIKEYYEPLWGKPYPPKIVTLTKPFSLSKEGAQQLNEFFGKTGAPSNIYECGFCKDKFDTPGHKVLKVVSCPGSGKPHQLDLQKI